MNCKSTNEHGQRHMTNGQIAATIIVMVLWGVNFLAVKETVDYLPPFLAVGIRFAAVGLCLIPFAPYPKGKTKPLINAGLLLGVGHFGLLFFGMRYVEVGVASVVNRIGGVVLAILGVVLLGEIVSLRLWLGLALSMVGVVVLVAENQTLEVSLAATNSYGVAILLVSSSIWSFATVYMKNSLSNVSTLCQLAWVAIYSVPGCLLLSLVFEVNQLSAIMSAPAGAWMGLVYTVVGSSLAAYGIWYELVKRCEVSKLSAFLFLMPIVGVVIGMMVRGESLTWMKLLGTALILYAMKLLI